jgi:hypothetical protein
MSKLGQKASKSEGGTPAWFELVRQHVASLQYGVVQIVVHDSEVIQIEKTERMRFEKPRPNSH